VTTRLESLRQAGYLDDARLERPSLRTSWHREVIAVAGTLLVACVVLPLVI
jgi:hypothetical protein